MTLRALALLIVLSATAAQAHEWYRSLKVPDGAPGAGTSCCHEEDCREVPHRHGVGGRDEILINGRWQPVDPRYLLDEASPDGRWHACTGRGIEFPRCVIQAGGTV